MRTRIFLFITLLTIASVAQARPINLYIGGSLGDSVGLDGDDFDLDFDGFAIENNDRSLKVFAGVSLGRLFGVEAAFHDFGSVVCCEGVADIGFTAGVDGFSVAAVFGIPVGRLRLFAKLGVISWEADGVLESIVGNARFTLDGEDPMGGVGVDLKLTKHVSARAEIEVFKLAGGGLDMASVGLQFSF